MIHSFVLFCFFLLTAPTTWTSAGSTNMTPVYYTTMNQVSSFTGKHQESWKIFRQAYEYDFRISNQSRSKAMYVYTGPDRNRSGFYLHGTVQVRSKCLHGTVLETVRNGCKWIQNWTCKKADPVLDPFESVRFQNGPV